VERLITWRSLTMWLLLLMMRCIKERRASSTSGRSFAKNLRGLGFGLYVLNSSVGGGLYLRRMLQKYSGGKGGLYLQSLVRNMFSAHSECSVAAGSNARGNVASVGCEEEGGGESGASATLEAWSSNLQWKRLGKSCKFSGRCVRACSFNTGWSSTEQETKAACETGWQRHRRVGRAHECCEQLADVVDDAVLQTGAAGGVDDEEGEALGCDNGGGARVELGGEGGGLVVAGRRVRMWRWRMEGDAGLREENRFDGCERGGLGGGWGGVRRARRREQRDEDVAQTVVDLAGFRIGGERGIRKYGRDFLLDDGH
jgi:hypothetical protein